MSEPTPTDGKPVLRREALVHAGQLLVAVLVAAGLTVLAIAVGWLPLCEKAAGLSVLGLSVLLTALVELIRYRPWRRGSPRRAEGAPPPD